jgi:hypothetical protein
MFNVGVRFAPGKSLQVIASGNTLRELPEPRALQDCQEFGLAYQDDLQQFLARGFEVCQEADLFEHLAAEILSFVDNEHGPPVLSVGLQQVLIQSVNEGLDAPGFGRERDAEFVADGSDQFGLRQAGIENQSNIGVRGQLSDQAPAERRFPRPDLAGQLNEASRLLHAVDQMSKPFPVPLAHEEKPRIRGQRKWRFIQSEIFSVHALLPFAAAVQQNISETGIPVKQARMPMIFFMEFVADSC